MEDEPKVEQLENRIDKLESTIEKMMPSRRDALKMGGAALVGGAAMSGTASAGTNQVGTIGSASQPVDLESEDITNADTVTTDTLDASNVLTGSLESQDPEFGRTQFTIEDDTRKRMSNFGFSGTSFHLFMIHSDTTREAALILTKDSGVFDIVSDGFYNVFGGTNNSLGGTDGPDGTFNIGRFFGETRFENRTGSSQTMRIIALGEREVF